MKTIKQKEALKALRPRRRLLSFKEFCQHVYEPSKRIRSLNLSEEETAGLIETIERREKPE
jgi:hypothetical protein